MKAASPRSNPAVPLSSAGGATSRPRADERDVFEEAIDALSAPSDDALAQAVQGGLPDPDEVIEWGRRVRRLVLYQRDRSELRSELPAIADRLEALLATVDLPTECDARCTALSLVRRLRPVRDLLALDVEAAFRGDPAAAGYDEIVVSYPSIRALAMHRIAHELHRAGVPMVPRILSEYAHDHTGIDIHPGASIGRHFFIDHGTGVVIGETAVIGNGVRLYQGVTIGAKTVRDRSSLVGVKRHPTLEDEVTVYAGAKILGGDVVIGAGSVIGGNVWLTESVPPGSWVVAEPARHLVGPRGQLAERAGDQLTWDL